MIFKLPQARLSFPQIIAGFLLLIMFSLEVTSIRQESPTMDETVHLASGFSAWSTGVYAFNREHPPLLKMLAAAPLQLTNLFFHKPLFNASWNNQWQYIVEDNFVYHNSMRAETLLFLGRLPIMGLSLVLGWFIFMWSKRLFGVAAGILSLTLYVFDPNIIAHSRYVTTDLGVALAFLAALFAFVTYVHCPSRKHLFLFSIVFGVAQVTKFSAIILWGMIPPFFLLFLLFYTEKTKRLKTLLTQGSQLSIGMIAGTLLVITLVYSPSLFHWQENMQLPLLATWNTFSFPPLNVYLDGLLQTVQHTTQGHPYGAYLLGRFSMQGWWYYFPIAFLVKTPLVTLLLIGVALLLSFWGWIRDALTRPTIPLPSFPTIVMLGAAFLYLATSMTNSINIGWRHLLPIYPMLFVFTGKLAALSLQPRTRLWPALLFLPVLALMSFSIRQFPFYLPYFSELVGGSSQGHTYLLDSNLDWGQDLMRLKRFTDEQHIPRMYLSYFGAGDAAYYGLVTEKLPRIQTQEDLEGLDGVVAISAHYLFNPKYGEEFAWLRSFEPITHIGYSILVYDFRK